MKPIMIPQSHDVLFKLGLKNKAMAIEFMEVYLPDDVKAICDLNTLQQEHGSFVKLNLSQRFNDVLYSINSKNLNEKNYIYCLIESQSKPDKFIAFRLMDYTIMVMDNHLKKGHKKLPLVVPILFYCGKKPHPTSISLNWLDLFADKDAAKRQYTQSFKLVDIQKTHDDEIKQHTKIGLMEYLLKHIHARDIKLMIDDLHYFFALNEFIKEDLSSFLIYLLNHGKIDKSNIEQFIDSLSKTQLGGGTMAMTTVADYLREQGEQRGLQLGEQRGRQEGEQKGLQKATLSIAKNMLKKGLDIAIIKETTGLSDDEISKLQ